MNGFKLAMCGWLLGASSVQADDLVLSPSPAVVQRTVLYAPQTSVALPVPTTTYYAPAAPTTTYYAPAPVPVTTYYAPAPAPVVTTPAPVPVTTYYAPVVTPRPVVTYYAPAATPVTTYYGTTAAAVPVTTYYAPAAALPIAVPAYGVVRSKVYYPGEPVRNFFKALAP